MHLFFSSVIAFACGWTGVVLLYLFKVIPVVKKRRGWKTIFEVGLQLNFSGHIREYGSLAKREKDEKMLKVYYLINILIVVSVLAFLTGIFSSLF